MDRVCPLLGLSLDRRVAVEVVDDAHRCHAEQPPSPLSRRQQAQLCLTSSHEQCPLYLGYLSRAGLSDPAWRAGLADGLVSTRLVLTPEPSWRGVAGREARGRPGPLLALVAAALATGIGGVALAGAMIDGGIALGDPATSPMGSPDPVTPAPTQSPVLGPTSSPAPSATPSPTPSPSPAPTAAPTAAPQRTYTVQQGDTLAAIAQQFGTTVRALQDANGIEDPNRITVGQVLVIP